MRRLGPTVLVIALLAATIAAFALAERLKLEPSPITDTKVPIRIFSPVCDCRTDEARIGFTVREPGHVIAVIVDADERTVRRLVDRKVAAGPLRLLWDGRDDEGNIVPEGAYTPRIRLPDEKRTIAVPTPIRVDVTPPQLTRATVAPPAFSPDGDRRNDLLRALYEVDERSHGLLYVDGERVVRTLFRRLSDTMLWPARNAAPLPAGEYTVAIGAEDDAGNVAEPVERTVRIRYVELARPVIRATTRKRFGVRVTSDARTVHWRFAGGSGTAAPGLLVLHAPRKPGRYRLFVDANGHGASSLVVVTRP